MLDHNVHAKVEGKYVYYQIRWTSGILVCKYSSGNTVANSVVWNKFSRNATYHGTFAQCDRWTKGNPSYSISLTLNGKTFTTDENTAISNGKINGM